VRGIRVDPDDLSRLKGEDDGGVLLHLPVALPADRVQVTQRRHLTTGGDQAFSRISYRDHTSSSSAK
jgi:hypothetical protein